MSAPQKTARQIAQDLLETEIPAIDAELLGAQHPGLYTIGDFIRDIAAGETENERLKQVLSAMVVLGSLDDDDVPLREMYQSLKDNAAMITDQHAAYAGCTATHPNAAIPARIWSQIGIAAQNMLSALEAELQINAPAGHVLNVQGAQYKAVLFLDTPIKCFVDEKNYRLLQETHDVAPKDGMGNMGNYLRHFIEAHKEHYPNLSHISALFSLAQHGNRPNTERLRLGREALENYMDNELSASAQEKLGADPQLQAQSKAMCALLSAACLNMDEIENSMYSTQQVPRSWTASAHGRKAATTRISLN